MKLKRVMRLDKRLRKYRIGRAMWTNGVVGDGNGYSACVSLALKPSLFSFHRDFHEWKICLLGLVIHYQRVYGGYHV